MNGYPPVPPLPQGQGSPGPPSPWPPMPAAPPQMAPSSTAQPQADWWARLGLLLDYLRHQGGVQNAGLGGSR